MGAVGERERLTLELESMAHGGDAIGRHQGKVIFVTGGVPGETVLAQILEDHGTYAHAAALEVTEPSPHRREDPRCPHFGDPQTRFRALTELTPASESVRFCGGCQWQHIDYEGQLELKEQILSDQLKRIGRVTDPPVQPAWGMKEPWFYRNSAQFSVPEDSGLVPELGFLGMEGERVVPIEVCYIIHPLLKEMYDDLEIEFPELERVSLRAGVNTGDQMVILETGEDAPPGLEVDLPVSCVFKLDDGTAVTLVGNDFITEELCGRTFRISAGSFFQVNTLMAEQLVQGIREFLEPQGDEVLMDLYCGVGTFGLLLADAVAEVIGIEENPTAIKDADFNAGDLNNVILIEGRAEDVLPEYGRQPDVVVIDPPRGGVAEEALGALIDGHPQKVIYVSCDPATLARDVRRLREGGYELLESRPVDFFPQTYHVESISLLTPRASSTAMRS